MKRLLNSSKFYLAIFGTIAGLIAWVVTENVTVSSLIIGLFGAGITGNFIEDAIKKKNNIQDNIKS